MQYGLVFVNGTPFDDATHTKRLLERIGPIRETHYGGFYDFVPDMAKADTAYTNIALPAHTDTTYFTEPAGVSRFLCNSPFLSLCCMAIKTLSRHLKTLLEPFSNTEESTNHGDAY